MALKQEDKALKADERFVFELRSLYRSYGYTHYRMSKFEEYDLYVRNKDFLSSSGIITFTDTNGKLMALKPDVTLSIIKNLSSQTGVQKVFYNENVYRISKSSGRFREIMQTGLECVGDIGEYEICETLLLAAKSLEAAGCDFRLDIAHTGILTAFMDSLALTEKKKNELLTCIKRKNTKGIQDICDSLGSDKRVGDAFASIIGLYGAPNKILPELKAICGGSKGDKAVSDLNTVAEFLSCCGYADKINIDFSVINDMNYYNGIVFQGYVSEVPEGVLSGGCYDLLMKKMGRDCGGIGFAICLDSLSRLYRDKKEYDYDVILIYGDASAESVISAVNRLSGEGISVFASRKMPESAKAGKILMLTGDGNIKEESSKC